MCLTLMCLNIGVKCGDRVAIYMPMVVELVVAMLACARIGAIHSIVVRKTLCQRDASPNTLEGMHLSIH